MRILVALALLAACGKHLNAEFCAQNPKDPDCLNAGLTVIDAPHACTSDSECPGEVCDTGKGQCVQCVMGNEAACGAQHCGTDDTCHECLNDSQCSAGICQPDVLMCLSNDSFLYAAPNGSGSICSMAAPCTLAGAIAKLDALHRGISVATGDYHEGPLMITASAVLIGQGANGDPSLTKVTMKAGGTGPVITTNAAAGVAIDYMSVYGGDTDGVSCAGGSLTFLRSLSYGNGAHGISSTGGCKLDVERSQIYTNGVDALFTQASDVKVLNNFMFDNGRGNQDGGAVRLGPGTTGALQYNSVAFNHYKNPSDGGFTCDNGASAAADFNIFSGDVGKQEYTRGGCEMRTNYVASDAGGVGFKSSNPPYDLHLTDESPSDAEAGIPIRDNTNTTCTALDIDGDARPYNTFCDLGADEYH